MLQFEAFRHAAGNLPAGANGTAIHGDLFSAHSRRQQHVQGLPGLKPSRPAAGSLHPAADFQKHFQVALQILEAERPRGVVDTFFACQPRGAERQHRSLHGFAFFGSIDAPDLE